MRRSKVLIAPLVIAVLMAACSDDDGTSATSTEGQGTAVSVHIPSQYEEALGVLVDGYESENPDADVEVVVEEQDALTASVVEGTADLAILPDLLLEDVESTLATGEFGRNLAVIVVPKDNPAGIEGAEAFAPESGLATAVCGEDIPGLGNISLLVLADAGVTPDPDTVATGCEDDVVAQVGDGELDAAFVYRMGVVLPDGVEVVEIPEDENLVLDISYVVVNEGGGSTEFVEFIESDTGQEILTENGYLP